MKNFRTAIKDSLHHSPAILLATLCSVGVAVLWASNIGALSPVINMTLNGESMQSFMEKSIESGEERVRKWESELLVAREESEIGDERSLEKNIRTEQANLAWSQWGLSWANALLPRDPFRTICWIMGLLIVSTLVKHFLMLANDLLIGHVSTSIVRALRQRVFDAALSMDRKTYQTFGTSGLLAAITSAADGLAVGLMAVFGAAVREPLRIGACLIGASIISWRLLLLSIVLAPFLILVIYYFNRKIRAVAASIISRNAGFHEVMLEALSNVFTVQAFTMEKKERERFSECTDDMRRISLKMIFYTGLGKPFTELIGVGMVAITICAGAYLVVNKQTHIFYLRICDNPMSVSDLLTFFGFLIGASDPLRKLSGLSVAIFGGTVSANLLYGILESKPVLVEPLPCFEQRSIPLQYRTTHPQRCSA